MEKAIMAGAMALAAAGVCGGNDAQKAAYQVTVYLMNQQIAEPLLLARAEALASSIFAGIDIHLRWKIGDPPRRPKAGRPSCLEAEVLIALVSDTPASFHPGAPAYSRPYGQSGVRVTVFYDRVLDPLRDNMSLGAAVLGHILAHEITHVLQGIARHSEVGLMKARWSSADRDQMKRGPLAFAPEDVKLIWWALDRRSCGTQLAVPPSSQLDSARRAR